VWSQVGQIPDAQSRSRGTLALKRTVFRAKLPVVVKGYEYKSLKFSLAFMPTLSVLQELGIAIDCSVRHRA